jgi:hypothetical protein
VERGGIEEQFSLAECRLPPFVRRRVLYLCQQKKREKASLSIRGQNLNVQKSVRA